jgi:hypothetical protein
MARFIAAVAVMVLAGCASQEVSTKHTKHAAQEISYSGGTGDSFEDAIIINGVDKQSESVEAEYRYLAKLHGEKDKSWRVEAQTVTKEDKRIFDEIEIVLIPTAEKRIYYFDITRFAWKRTQGE